MISFLFDSTFWLGVVLALIIALVYIHNKAVRADRIGHYDSDRLCKELLEHYRNKDVEGIKNFLEKHNNDKSTYYIIDERKPFSATLLWDAMIIHVSHKYALYDFNGYDSDEWKDIALKTFGNNSVGYKKYVGAEEILNRACNYYLENGLLRKEKIDHGGYMDYATEEYYEMIYLIISSSASDIMSFGEYSETEEISDKRHGYSLVGQIHEEKGDIAEAIKYYEIAALDGDTNAQCKLGLLFYGGSKVPKNDYLAFNWFRVAANNGSDLAMFFLAQMMKNGEGTRQDASSAVEWYEKSAEFGNATALDAIGEMYLKGEGVEKNGLKAVDYYLRAANKGEAHSQLVLAFIYARGDIVPFNEEYARYWFEECIKQDAYYETSRADIEELIKQHK